MDAIPAAALNYPAQTPPPGVTPNLVDPPSQGKVLIGLPAALISLMWIAVIGRIIVKTRIVKTRTVDDVTCVIAAILTTFYFGITVASVQHEHIGTHLWNVRLGDYISDSSIKIEFLSAIFAPITLMFIKASFFLMFLYIFKPLVHLRIACWIGLAITVLGYTGWFIAFMVLGVPRWGETWQSHFLGPLQLKEATLSIPLPAFGLALDIIILLLPLYGVNKLQLSLKRKLGVMAIFFTAIIAILCSILSIVYRVNLQNEGEYDITWNLLPAFITSDLEMTLGVIILCMPSFSSLIQASLPFYHTLRSRLTSRLSRTQSRPSYGGTTDKDHYSLASSQREGSLGQGYSSHVSGGSSGNRKYSQDNESKNGIQLTTVVRQESSVV